MIEETPTEQTPLKQNSKRFSRSASASSASGHRGQPRVEPAFPDERRFGNNSFQSSTTLSLSSDPRLISVHCRTTMDNTKTVLLKVGFDFFILCCVGFPILIFFVVGDPFKRGFFCDDESLMHPFHDSTITNWMLYIIGLALPVIVILITEFLRNRAKHSETQPLKVFNTDISHWVVQAYKSIGMFGFGAAVSQLLTDVGKYTIGRLRPHFFDVCRPMMPNNTTCADAVNHGRYITDFVCTSEKSSTRMLKEMRLSFPSGHSSFSMYTLVFCAIFLQSRMNWRGSKLLKHFFQFLLILLAWYTCLSRISDYKHHWSDVLAGGVLGATVAIVVSNFCTDLFAVYRKRSIMSLPQTRYELSANHAAPVNGSQ